MKLGAKELRVSEPTKSDLTKIKRREIYIILDNILDTYNIGSIFRLADAVAVKKVYLCGKTQTPPYHRIAKAAVGTEKWVPWEYKATAAEAISDVRKSHSGAKRSGAIESASQIVRSSSNKIRLRALESRSYFELSRNKPSYRSLRSLQDDKKRKVKVIAIEQSKKSKDFRKVDYSLPIAFVVGNETEGLSRRILDMADEIVEIPMFGVNRSLNVMVSLAMILSKMMENF